MRLKAEGQKLFIFEPDKTALVIVDMQNEFILKGGLIYVKNAIKTVTKV